MLWKKAIAYFEGALLPEEKRTIVRLGFQESIQPEMYYKLLNISWHSFVSQCITKMAEEDFLDKFLSPLSILDHLIAIIECVAITVFWWVTAMNFLAGVVVEIFRFPFSWL